METRVCSANSLPSEICSLAQGALKGRIVVYSTANAVDYSPPTMLLFNSRRGEVSQVSARGEARRRQARLDNGVVAWDLSYGRMHVSWSEVYVASSRPFTRAEGHRTGKEDA